MRKTKLLLLPLLLALVACNEPAPSSEPSSSASEDIQTSETSSESSEVTSEDISEDSEDSSENIAGGYEIDPEDIGKPVTLYLALSDYGLYNGEPGEKFPELNLDNAVKIETTVGADLPGADAITSTNSSATFEAWQVYLPDFPGSPTIFTKAPLLENEILFVKWKYSGIDGGDELPTEGYGLEITPANGTVRYVVLEPVKEFDGFKQYLGDDVALKEGDSFKLYNFSNSESWSLTKINSAGQGSKFTATAECITCNADGVYDIYVKLKYGADELYIGDSNGK